MLMIIGIATPVISTTINDFNDYFEAFSNGIWDIVCHEHELRYCIDIV